MGTRTSKLLVRLRQPGAIRAQVLTYLFIVRIHSLVKSSYDNYLACGSFASSKSGTNQNKLPGADRSTCQCEHSDNEPHEIEQVGPRKKQEEEERVVTYRRRSRRSDAGCAPIEQQLERDGKPSKQVKALDEDKAKGRGEASGRGGCNMRGLPDLSPPVRCYELATSVWMIWAIIRTLFLNQLEVLISPATHYLFRMPGNCLLPGRLAHPLVISPLITVLLASHHMLWRVWHKCKKHDRPISLVVFLLASERNLDRFYTMLEAEHGRPLNSQPGSKWATLARENSITGAGSTQAESQIGLQASECLFLGAMCHPVYQRDKASYFRLRVNRTPEARAKLARHLALTSLTAITAFCLGFSMLLVYIVVTIYSDYRYAHVYRGCHAPLERLRASGQLEYFTWSLLNGHHLLSGLIFDAIENIVIWGDSGLAVIFVPVFFYLLNYDLLLHWSGIEVKLERLLERVKHQYIMREEHKPQQSTRGSSAARQYDAFNRDSSDLLEGYYHELRHWEQSSWHTDEEPLRLEADIHEIQFELCDFFHQIKRVDGMMGDALTYVSYIWFSSCAFVSYNQLQYNPEAITMFVKSILALGFFIITLATYHLLELRRCCLKSHRVLCSLMAYDQSSCKRAFIKLLEYYTTDRTNYHVLRTYAYKPTTFITIVGWSFSCFFIMHALFGSQYKGHSLAVVGGSGD